MYGNVVTRRDDHDDDEDDGMYEVVVPTKDAEFDCEGAMPTKTETPFHHGTTIGDV